jgi:ABC-type glycerol-3-phosphate transport system substrate-binding protein
MRPTLCALVLALLLSGCGGDQRDDVVTLRFWHSFVSSTRPALDALIEQFEQEHPDIRIQAQYVPTGDGLVRKLVSSIQSGTAPDLSWVHADFLGNLVQSDAIYPMSTFLDGEDGLTDDELADFFPATLQAARWRDTLYALPMEATLLALIYNKDHFREAGIDPDRPPATWADLREYSRRLTKDTDGNGRIDRFGFYVPVFPASGPLSVWMVLQWSPYIWGAGGALIDHEQTRVLYDSEAGVRALTFWKDLFLDMDSPALSMTHDAHFTAGHVSIIMDGPWDLPRFRELEHIDWGIAPLPAGPDEQVTYLAGEHLAIFRQTEHADEAWTFVKWVTQPEVQAFFSKESGYLPVRQSALDLPSYQEHLEDDWALRAFVDQMSLGRARRPIDLHQVEINRHIAEAIESALIGGEEPAAALRASAAKSNALLRE